METIYLKQIMRGCWVLLISLSVILALYWMIPLLYPFILAWIIAYFLNPIVNTLQQYAHLPRWLAVTLTMMAFVGAMLTIVSAVITRIIIELFNVSQTLEHSIGELKNMLISFLKNEQLSRFVAQISSFYDNNNTVQNTINGNMNQTAQTITNTISDLISGLFNSILTILSSLPNIATICIVVLLALFFISKDWLQFVQWFRKWMPIRMMQPASIISVDLQKALFGYIRAQCIVILMTTIVVIIGLLILKVEYAITIGLLIGILDFMPYLGVGAAMIPWIAYTFMNHDSSLGIGLSILYGFILIARQIIEPKVLATSVGLHPLPTLIAMFVGLQLFGILGFIIGPVALVILQAVHRANVFRDIWQYVAGHRR